MCIECVSKLSRAFSFRKQCWEADTLLRSDFEADDTIEDETIIKKEEIIVDDLDSSDFIEMTSQHDSYYDADSTKIEVEEYFISELVDQDTDDNMNMEFLDETQTYNELPEIENIREETTIKPNKIKKVQQLEKGDFLCSECGFQCDNIQKFRNHYRYHHNSECINTKRPKAQTINGEFVCEICDKRFGKLHLYKRHMRIHDPTNPNKCEICDLKFAAPSLLESHMYTHTGERPFKCEICGKTTRNRSDMSTHMRFHSNERPYKCTQCHKSFVTGSHWRAHEKTHITDAIFECTICNKRFKTDKVLKSHSRLHDVSKHIKCEFCDKTFATSKHILRHMLKHPEFVPFTCKFCERQFLRLPLMETHVRIHHPGLL